MQLHGNTALTPNQRVRLARREVADGWSLGEAAGAAEVSEPTARLHASRRDRTLPSFYEECRRRRRR